MRTLVKLLVGLAMLLPVLARGAAASGPSSGSGSFTFPPSESLGFLGRAKINDGSAIYDVADSVNILKYTYIDNGTSVYSHLVDRLYLSPRFNSLSNKSYFGNVFTATNPTNSTWGRFFYKTNAIYFQMPRSVRAFTLTMRMRQGWLAPLSAQNGIGMVSMPMFSLQSLDGLSGVLAVSDRFFGYQLITFSNGIYPFSMQANLNNASPNKLDAKPVKCKSTAVPFTFPPATYTISYDGRSNLCAFIDTIPCYINGALTNSLTNTVAGSFQVLCLGVVTNWSNLAVVQAYSTDGGTFGGEIMDVQLYDTNCTATLNTNLVGASYKSSMTLEKIKRLRLILGDSLMAAFENDVFNDIALSPTNNIGWQLARHSPDVPWAVYAQGDSNFGSFTTNQVSGRPFPTSIATWLPANFSLEILCNLGHNDSFANAPVTNSIIQVKLEQAFAGLKSMGAKYVNFESPICWTNGLTEDLAMPNTNYLKAWNMTCHSNPIVDVSLPVFKFLNQTIYATNANPQTSRDGVHFSGTNGWSIYAQWADMYLGNDFLIQPLQGL